MKSLPISSSLLFLSFISTASMAANEFDPEIYRHASIGYELDRFHNEFGVGMNVTSPFFLDGRLAIQGAIIRSSYNAVIDNEYTWLNYNTYKVGLVGSHPITSNIRTYGVGGVVYLTPNNQMSDKSSVTGGYGAFGFEFLQDRRVTYFVELGGIGTGARADKLPGKPIYSNGFLETVGFKIYL